MLRNGHVKESLKTVLKNTAAKLGVEIRRKASSERDGVVSFEPRGKNSGRVLLCHSLLPFLLAEGDPLMYRHTGHWRGLQMAKTFVELNYSVDVIDLHNQAFIPKESYSCFVDFYVKLERIAPLINTDCLRIRHIETAHWLFQNAAEYERLGKLKERRGACLKPRRQLIPHWGIQHSDCGVIQGNDFTCSTYGFANKSLYRVPTPASLVFEWPQEKDWEACRKNFLWFGGSGLVHKGLDLTLEAFKEMPDYHLTVCGPIESEEDFRQAYYKELFQTPNIETVGWVDIRSQRFGEIVNNCIALVHPTCSEGQSGAVVTCLQASMIPVISYQTGVDVNDFGFIMKDCSVERIKDSVRMIADLPAQELKERARKAWEFARANHTREKFAEEYRKAVVDIITAHPRSRPIPRPAANCSMKGGAPLEPVNQASDKSGPKAVINVDDCNVRSAAVEHTQQGSDPLQTCAVADTGRYRDNRDWD
jgi:glycosyltransferase involved in cell wall biosynthesis